jgi:hypothetical protein
MPAAQAKVRFPAQNFSRIYPRKVDAKAFTIGGASTSFDLLPYGWCDGLLLKISGTYTVATATLVFLPRSPWNIFSRAIVQPPSAQPIINTGGHHLHMDNLRAHSFAPFAHGNDIGLTGLDANGSTSQPDSVFPTAVGAQTATLWYWIPFARSSYDPTGALGLGNPTKTQLILNPEVSANLFTTPANFTVPVFTATLWQFIYAAFPEDSSVVPWDTSVLITLEEQNNPIVAVGEQPAIIIDAKDKILHVAHAIFNTNVQAYAAIDQMTLQLDDAQYTQYLDPITWAFVQRRRLGFALPPEFMLYDFDYQVDADGSAGKLYGPAFEPSKGPWIRTQKVNSVKSILRVAAGTALANGPTIFTYIRRMAAVKGAPQAGGA